MSDQNEDEFDGFYEPDGPDTRHSIAGLMALIEDDEFPPHDPDFPDVNPKSGDERETTDVGSDTSTAYRLSERQ